MVLVISPELAGGQEGADSLRKPRPERGQAHAHLTCPQQRRERALEARQAHPNYGTALNHKERAGGTVCW